MEDLRILEVMCESAGCMIIDQWQIQNFREGVSLHQHAHSMQEILSHALLVVNHTQSS